MLTDEQLAEMKARCDAAHAVGSELRAEVERLREWKADCEASFRETVEEPCPPDERHCACVPPLRAVVAELRARIAELEAELARYTALPSCWQFGRTDAPEVDDADV